MQATAPVRSSVKKVSLALAVSAAIQAACIAPGYAYPHGDTDTRTPIKHLVVIFQENVSFDHYFGSYPQAANPAGEPGFTARDGTPSVNGLTEALMTGNQNAAPPVRLDRSEAATCDQDHGYTDEQKAADSGLLDRFIQATGRNGVGCLPNGQTVMGYYDGNTVTALWNYAQRFAMSDNSFDTEFGPSSPGAINLVSGQTHGASAFRITAPGVGTPAGSGAIAANSLISDADPYLDDCGVDQGGTRVNAVTVQMSGPNVGDLLNAKGVTWGWFQGGFAPTVAATFNPDGSLKTPAICGASHTAHPNVPNPVDGNAGGVDVHTPVSDYSAHHEPFMYYTSTWNPHHLRPTSVAMIGRTDQANHQYDLSDFFAALDHGNLPAVSYLKAPAYQDGHPGYSDPISEQAFLVQVINALQKSKAWKDTAVVINYDDSDGWYDHVTGPIVNPSALASVDSFVALPGNTAGATSPGQIPTSGNCGTPAASAFSARCGYGPRLPFIVISPWAKRNYVDHATTDQTSSLRFIEENWNLGFIDGPTAPQAGQASFDRLAGSMNGMLDFRHGADLRPFILDPDTGEVVRDGDRR